MEMQDKPNVTGIYHAMQIKDIGDAVDFRVQLPFESH